MEQETDSFEDSFDQEAEFNEDTFDDDFDDDFEDDTEEFDDGTTSSETPGEVAEGERLTGSVKWYSVNKGYGFVAGEDDEDYFVHYTQLPEATILEEDDEVEFTPVETEKGLQAQDVELQRES